MASFEIRHLRCFATVADERHFSRAADRLHLTQPALSRTIRQFEAVIGMPLFTRSTRSVGLTEAGQALLASSHAALKAFDSAVAEASRIGRGEAGTIIVAHTEIAVFGRLPDILHDFRSAFPNMGVSLLAGVTASNLAAVRDGLVDVAFVTGAVNDHDLEGVLLWEEGSVAVLAAGHPLARRRKLRISDLADEAFVLGPSNTWKAYRPLIEAACRKNGFEPRMAQEAESSSALVQLVASGVGVTVHPACISEVSSRQVVSRALMDEGLKVGTYVVVRKDNASRAVRNFVRVARSVCVKPATPGATRSSKPVSLRRTADGDATL